MSRTRQPRGGTRGDAVDGISDFRVRLSGTKEASGGVNSFVFSMAPALHQEG